MATPAKVTDDLAFRIGLIARSLADLSSILEDRERGTLGGDEWTALGQEWGADMGTLRVIVDPIYRAGRMTRAQAACYRRLLQDLKAALPVMDKLGFSRPLIVLDGD